MMKMLLVALQMRSEWFMYFIRTVLLKRCDGLLLDTGASMVRSHLFGQDTAYRNGKLLYDYYDKDVEQAGFCGWPQ